MLLNRQNSHYIKSTSLRRIAATHWGTVNRPWTGFHRKLIFH